MEDLFAKKKETSTALDLSKSVANSPEELKKLMEKVPDYKIKAEKVPVDSIKLTKEKHFKFKSYKNDLKAMKEPYAFLNPLPNELSSLKISDLSAVPIDWKMLTSARPKSKIEENYFSRMIELAKSERKTRVQEKREYAKDTQIRKIKNRAGILETKVVACEECGVEFCNGKMCTKFSYDSFTRMQEDAPISPKKKTLDSVENPKRKIKRRSRSRKKAGKKEASPRKKSKSPTKKSTNKKK